MKIILKVAAQLSYYDWNWKIKTSDQEKKRLTALRTIVNKHQAKCNSKEMKSSLVSVDSWGFR